MKFRMKSGPNKGALTAILLGGTLLAAGIAGGSKRHNENSMPINLPIIECKEKLIAADEIQMREVPFT